MVYQIGSLVTGASFGNGYSVGALIIAFIALAAFIFGLIRKNPYAEADSQK